VHYGRFARPFTIPEGIKPEEVQADYRNGALELVVPLPASVLP
jgi:HSP20 family molecular chaperone IbpA